VAAAVKAGQATPAQGGGGHRRIRVGQNAIRRRSNTDASLSPDPRRSHRLCPAGPGRHRRRQAGAEDLHHHVRKRDRQDGHRHADASNVNSVQAQYATCGQAKKAMNRITALRIEEPKSVAGFYCLPTVTATGPDAVKYKCTFKGADTPMFVKLLFQVKYNLD
jgi:hypothetical protein